VFIEELQKIEKLKKTLATDPHRPIGRKKQKQ
jgi:hypothetical protein